MKHVRKLLAVLLTMVMTLVLALPMSFAADEPSASRENDLRVMVMSDMHTIPEAMIKGTADYQHAVDLDQKVFNESEAILDAQLQQVKFSKPDVLLLNGDITKDGEYAAHKSLAAKLKQLKKDLPDLKVYVTNGNHDINNPAAKNFNTESGKAVKAKRTTQKDFLAIYKNVTWNDKTVTATYTPPEGAEAGALSYVARPKKGFTIIVIDSNCYTSDNTSDGEQLCEVRGNIPEDLLKWAQKQARAARKRGDTVIGMMHHGVVSHFTQESTILGHFLVDDFQTVSTKLADAGMHYVFTGHQHSQDVAVMRTEKGNTLYDIETGSSITYPCPMRAVWFLREGSAKTDNGWKETVKGSTIKNLSIAHTDPQTGEYVAIDDMTAYAKNRGLSATIVSAVLKDKLYWSLPNYPKELDTVIDKLIPDLCNIPVTDDGKYSLIDLVNYANQSHQGGTDNGQDPAWVKEGKKNVAENKFLAALTDTLCKDLAALTGQGVNKLTKTELVKGPAVDLLYHSLFGAAHVSYYTVPQIAEDLDEFLVKTLESMTNDKNYPNDNAFTITGANKVVEGKANWSSLANGISDTNLVQKLVAALLGNGKN
ncbi:MAG: metallophosphoesterase [Clostridia bacterium]|nr:metallophosphoesterase [Clostridia bacterium]MBQ2566902.1 metallophosphoesterase [Clostridia bacterium]MBQ3328028.1 metallophosphoesterase [Clostridia bacterium]MBQ3995602.1 metallophosphoesterase [Clostridia bacterium]MBQ5479956.1 metallophosphoesterase [Clostridia bacterium]